MFQCYVEVIFLQIFIVHYRFINIWQCSGALNIPLTSKKITAFLSARFDALSSKEIVSPQNGKVEPTSGSNTFVQQKGNISRASSRRACRWCQALHKDTEIWLKIMAYSSPSCLKFRFINFPFVGSTTLTLTTKSRSEICCGNLSVRMIRTINHLLAASDPSAAK